MARAQEIVDDLGYQPASPQRGATALLPAPSIPVISAGNPSLFRDLIRGGEPTALVRRTARIQAIATRPQERD